MARSSEKAGNALNRWFMQQRDEVLGRDPNNKPRRTDQCNNLGQ
ncbi:Isy1-like splicing family protein, partial [Kipferlia bialata]|eukprot:g3180.t1